MALAGPRLVTELLLASIRKYLWDLKCPPNVAQTKQCVRGPHESHDDNDDDDGDDSDRNSVRRTAPSTAPPPSDKDLMETED